MMTSLSIKIKGTNSIIQNNFSLQLSDPLCAFTLDQSVCGVVVDKSFILSNKLSLAQVDLATMFQKPLMLHGHERSITQIKYNREGDLLFSAAKDQSPNVWYSINGERLGSFVGHNGTVWCIDVNCILYMCCLLETKEAKKIHEGAKCIV